MKVYLVTGGAGFIGSNFVHYILEKYPNARVVNLDKLTYAGNLANLEGLEGSNRYRFVKGDICDQELVDKLFAEEKFDYVVNFAAETHVDRSIGEAASFVQTDMFGAYVLLEAAKKHGIERFVQISTDEVYGSVESGSFTEESALNPRNPYSASKAGGDRLAFSYWATYDLPVVVTRASNNYGPNQYPEKLIPLFVTNALEGKKLPLYGDGLNIRDWLFVRDHCSAVDFILNKGTNGQTYNIAGGNERTNKDITGLILEFLGKDESLIEHVPDRPGHDRRYSLNADKLRALGWTPRVDFEKAIEETVLWYKNNPQWWEPLKNKTEYKDYYKGQYDEKK